jgi:hypothetical protein
VLREDATRKGLNLAEGDSLETTRALKAEAEPADTAEKIQNAEHVIQPGLW